VSYLLRRRDAALFFVDCFRSTYLSEEGKELSFTRIAYSIQVNESSLTLECCIWFCSILS
jgi:hypothetical protein